MSSDYKDKRTEKSSGVLCSFQFALKGLKHAFKHERNMRIHVLISLIVIVTGFIVKLSQIEWLFVLFAVGGVIVLELINTALERIVDLVTKEYHPLAEQAKDVAAGAVFVYAVLSVIVGIIIFLPKIIQF